MLILPFIISTLRNRVPRGVQSPLWKFIVRDVVKSCLKKHSAKYIQFHWNNYKQSKSLGTDHVKKIQHLVV